MAASCVNQLLGSHGAILVASRSEIGWPKSVVASLPVLPALAVLATRWSYHDRGGLQASSMKLSNHDIAVLQLCLSKIRSSPRVAVILPDEPQRSMGLRTLSESSEPNSL